MGLRDVALRILRAPEEQRAIVALPWDAGGPMRPASVSAEQALGLVPVFAAVRLLASQVASLPLQTYRKTGDTRMKIPSGPLFLRPSVQGTLYDWLHRCVTSLALRGNAYGLITQRDRDQYPTMVEWLHPDDIRCDDRAASGPGSFANPTWYWMGRYVPTEDLVHIPWFTVPGRVQGLSPIGACAATISTGISAQNYTSDWFDNGAVPPGEFRNTEKKVVQADADVISARLNAAIKRRKPLVYGNDWEYKPISVSAHEAKFVETLKMNATQIAAVYGIPPEMVGGEAGGALTYNTVEQNSLNFLKYTLRPWLELLEAAFYQLSPRPQYVKFNIDALLRSDLTTRMQAYNTARQIGLQNIDEQRALEDLPPLPGGKGQDYTPLAILAKQAATPPAPALRTRYPDAIDAEEVDDYQPRHVLEAAIDLHARRDDPYHPAALGTDAGPKALAASRTTNRSGSWTTTRSRC
jgi:HK97 family phage portal protein